MRVRWHSCLPRAPASNAILVTMPRGSPSHTQATKPILLGAQGTCWTKCRSPSFTAKTVRRMAWRRTSRCSAARAVPSEQPDPSGTSTLTLYAVDSGSSNLQT